MFLANLQIENLRGFKSLELPFTNSAGEVRRWTYILGENGVGKSTLLRAIALVTAGSNAMTELVGNPDDWIRLGSDECLIRAELRTAKKESRWIEMRIGRGNGIADLLKRNMEGLNQLDEALAHTLRNYPVIAYGVSRRSGSGGFAIPETAGSSANPRALSVATLFNPDARLTPVEHWAMDLEYRRGDEGLQVIRSAFEKLIPNVSFHGIDREKRRLMFQTPDGLVPYQFLSDGYQTIVGWIGDLLYRITETFSNYKNPLEARGLLMLDEIELHLHPLWQRRLADFLSKRLPNFQIIATTHAPMTAHQAGEGELFILRRGQQDPQPQLYHYEDEPRRLMLHQLLQTPAFGLETLDSSYVEGMRNDLRKLRATKGRGPRQEKKLAALRETLAGLPDWNSPSERESGQRELMEKIARRLRASEGRGKEEVP